MYGDMADKMANILVDYSTQIKPGDFVVVQSSPNATPLVEAVYELLIQRGAHVWMQIGLPGINEIFLRNASDEQLAWVNPAMMLTAREVDVVIQLLGETNPKALTGIDPTKIQKSQQAHAEFTQTFMQRIGTGEIRYMHTLWPTHASAQNAEMGLHTYREFVYKACGLDQPDPVAFWQDFRARQEKLVAWLADKKHAEIKGPGIDLAFDFADRVWISCHGDMNFPDGEIYTGPIEDSVNGHVAFSYPSLYGGQEVSGIKLTFKDGVVTEASAEKGEDVLLSQLEVDEGARRLGEFAIGTNFGVDRYTGNTLFDEKIGGTIHMALGASIPDSKGVNQSSIHWDIVHGMQDGGEITIDGELFYRSGQFMIEA